MTLGLARRSKKTSGTKAGIFLPLESRRDSSMPYLSTWARVAHAGPGITSKQYGERKLRTRIRFVQLAGRRLARIHRNEAELTRISPAGYIRQPDLVRQRQHLG